MNYSGNFKHLSANVLFHKFRGLIRGGNEKNIEKKRAGRAIQTSY